MKKKGLLFVKRGQNGCRNYLAEDREWVQFLCKLKATGMLLRDIKRYAQLRYNGDGTIAERLELLLKHQVYVAEEVHKWQQYSENLQAKIAVYQEQGNYVVPNYRFFGVFFCVLFPRFSPSLY